MINTVTLSTCKIQFVVRNNKNKKKRKLSKKKMNGILRLFFTCSFLINISTVIFFHEMVYCFSNSNKPHEVVMIILYNKCPVLIEEWSILGFRV